MRHLSLIRGDDDECGTVVPGSTPSNGHHILVVDDGAFSRRLTKRRLEEAGFRVTFAEHALAAGAVDAIACSLASFLALAPCGDGMGEASCLPIIAIAEPDDVDEELRDLVGELGATALVAPGEIADAILDALWELPLSDDALGEIDQRRT